MKRFTARRILVLNTHGIGDVLMSAPALLDLQDEYSSSDISIAVKSKVEADVLSASGVKASYIHMDRKGWKTLRSIMQLWDFRRRRFDLVIGLPGTHPTLGPLLAFLTGARYRVGIREGKLGRLYNVPAGFDAADHKVARCQSLMSALDVSPNHERPEIRICDEIRNRATAYLDSKSRRRSRLVGVAPGGGIVEAHKRWPPTSFGWVLSRLAERIKDVTFVILGSSSESDLGREIIDSVNDASIINAVGDLSILETAAIIADTRLMIGSDNGLMHLASAVGTPTLALFGPTNPEITGPHWGLVEAISANIVCSPCYRRGFIQGCENAICMRLISPRQVFEQAAKILATTDRREKESDTVMATSRCVRL